MLTLAIILSILLLVSIIIIVFVIKSYFQSQDNLDILIEERDQLINYINNSCNSIELSLENLTSITNLEVFSDDIKVRQLINQLKSTKEVFSSISQNAVTLIDHHEKEDDKF